MKYRIAHPSGVLIPVAFCVMIIMFAYALIVPKFVTAQNQASTAIRFYALFALAAIMIVLCTVEDKIGERIGSQIYIEDGKVRMGYVIGWKTYDISRISDLSIYRSTEHKRKHGFLRYIHYNEPRMKLEFKVRMHAPITMYKCITLTDLACERLSSSELGQVQPTELEDEEIPLFQFYQELSKVVNET